MAVKVARRRIESVCPECTVLLYHVRQVGADHYMPELMTAKERSTVQLTTDRGHQLLAFADDSITSEIRDLGLYDQWTLLAIEHLLNAINADICLDVGANIGNHAVVMAQHCRQLHAFEPVPFIFDVLKQNLKHNSSNAIAHNVALSELGGVSRISVDGGGNLGKSTMLSAAAGAELIDITAERGDDCIAEISGSIDFIKIDVEGFEPRVIQGLQQTIQKHQPILLLEWNSEQTKHGFVDADLFSVPLQGYQYHSLTHRRSKQVSGRGLKGAVKRALVKASNSNNWCLHTFDAALSYPNVLMFPQKWQSLAAALPAA